MTPAEQEAAGRLIQMIGSAVYMEDRYVVFMVLAALTREMCDRYGVELDAFFDAVRSAKTVEQAGGGAA